MVHKVREHGVKKNMVQERRDSGAPGRPSYKEYEERIPVGAQAVRAGAVPGAACGGRCVSRTSGRVGGAPSSVPAIAKTPPSRGTARGTTGGRGGWLLAGLKPSPIAEERIMGTRKTAVSRGRAAGARW